MKNMFPRAHIEPCRYSYGYAYEYSLKEGLYEIYGNVESAFDHEEALLSATASRLKSKRESILGGGGVSITAPAPKITL